MSGIGSVLIAILIFGLCVFLHELGHFTVGRLCGIGVEEFAIGFGPKIFGFRRKGIEYSLRILPLGGFCRFVGEDSDEKADNAMNNQPVWKRFLTVFAGPFMNIVLAVIAAFFLLWCFGISDVVPKIGSIDPALPAANSILEEGDVITEANGTAITYDSNGIVTLRGIIAENETVELTVDRNGETLTTTLAPKFSADENGETTAQIGVVFSTVGYSAAKAIPAAFEYPWDCADMMVNAIRDLIFGKHEDVGLVGPVGTIAVISEEVRQNYRLIVYFICILS
ncbi:MAG: site-2 protease family protein, partial [Clostridia bacterium]|nr:site-2 protease family protein [Clostridia bacterium]